MNNVASIINLNRNERVEHTAHLMNAHYYQIIWDEY